MSPWKKNPHAGHISLSPLYSIFSPLSPHLFLLSLISLTLFHFSPSRPITPLSCRKPVVSRKFSFATDFPLLRGFTVYIIITGDHILHRKVSWSHLEQRGDQWEILIISLMVYKTIVFCYYVFCCLLSR